MSIEAALIQFQLSDTPVQVIPRKVLRKTALTDLLRDVIDDLKSHFASESSRGHGHFADSSLVRTTREAAEKARDAYVSLESCERNRYDYEYFCVHPKVLACLPRHSKVLASGFASPDGEFDYATAEALTVCRCGELMYAGNSVVATQLAIFNGITTVDQLKIELWNLIEKKGTEEPSSMDTVTNQHIDAFNTATAETTAGSVAPRPAMMGGPPPPRVNLSSSAATSRTGQNRPTAETTAGSVAPRPAMMGGPPPRANLSSGAATSRTGQKRPVPATSMPGPASKKPNSAAD
ncbi:hypothetical protein ACLX1H_002036 [Fusarium chlamydosporum]